LITRLQVRNFKAFRDQEFDLAPLTLLAGLNGSGKSSLLQALLILRQSADLGLLEQGRVGLNGGLVHLGNAQDALFESADEDRIAIALEFDKTTKLEWSLGFASRKDRTAMVVGDPPKVDSTLCLFNDKFRFLAAERLGPRIHYKIPDLEIGSSDLGVQGEWAPHYLAAGGERDIGSDICAHPAARSLQLTHQVEAWMGEVSPGLQLHFSEESTLDLVGLSYSFVARRDTSSRYRPTNVGFGVSYTLPVVVAVLSAEPGDLLLLESPEAHLHPRGQAKLAELLSLSASAGVQIIVESHSDHIMNGVRVAVHQSKLLAEQVRFFYFRWNPDDKTGATQVQEIGMDSEGRISTWPDGFFDEIDRSLEILLTPKKP
jgi:predicted ATPase